MSATHAPCPAYSGQWFHKGTGACSCGASHLRSEVGAGSAESLMSKYLFTISPEHVGRAVFKVAGQNYWASSFIGKVLPTDVGKRVYRSGDVLQVENDGQRAARLGGAR